MKFEGEHPTIEFVETGWYSFDLALRESYKKLGISTRTITEVFGPTSIGKSHFINSLAGVLGKKLELDIACLDLELQNQDTVERILNNVEFDGTWYWVNQKRKPDEGKLAVDEKLLKSLYTHASKSRISILDSVASVVPISEIEGDVGDRNIGARAFPMAQFSRIFAKQLRYSEKGAFGFLANHRYEKVMTGLRFKTHDAPGGSVKENMAFIRIEPRVPFIPIPSGGKTKKLARFGTGWLFEGKVLKNRHGLSFSDFWVFIVGGEGVHSGLTAMFDCVKLGLAVIQKGASITMKDTGETFGRISKIVEDRHVFDFSTFYAALEAHQISAKDDMILIEKAIEERNKKEKEMDELEEIDDVIFVDISGEEDEE